MCVNTENDFISECNSGSEKLRAFLIFRAFIVLGFRNWLAEKCREQCKFTLIDC